MLIPGQNTLAEPAVVQSPGFEAWLVEFKQIVIDTVAASDPALAEQVRETLANEAEVSTKIVEACVTVLGNYVRRDNELAKQQLAWWAVDSNLDAKVADLGLERQEIDPGDPEASPPVPPTHEDDAHLRLRYYLAPHAPAAGSRMHYRHEGLTLGGRARVSVNAPRAGTVVVTYELNDDGFAAQVKDVTGRRTAPGEVMVTVLARDGDGTPSAALLDAARAHFSREDVCPETDSVTVQAAEIVRYRVKAVAYVNSGPDPALTHETSQANVQRYAAEHHNLEDRIDRTWLDYELHAAGAVQVEVIEPSEAIICGAHQAPYCEGIDIEVRQL